MTESMVERVARAIARHRNRVDRGWDVDDGWDIAEGRAAIAAMREPTEAMVNHLYDDLYPYPEDTWRAMIDAALADQPAPKGGEAGGTG